MIFKRHVRRRDRREMLDSLGWCGHSSTERAAYIAVAALSSTPGW